MDCNTEPNKYTHPDFVSAPMRRSEFEAIREERCWEVWVDYTAGENVALCRGRDLTYREAVRCALAHHHPDEGAFAVVDYY